MDIAGKVVLITGASGGIGLATARLLAQKGAKLALAARSTEKLEQVAAELPDTIALPTDMRNEADIQRMIEQTQLHFGRIDVLINNAGQGLHTPVEKVDLQQYREVFELNVVGVIAAMQDVIPIMREQGGGIIINISSGTSKIPIERMRMTTVGPYASTKYALNAISLTAHNELAVDNIRVGLVYPGVTATEFHSNLANGPRDNQNRPGGMPPDSAEYVAEKILEAIQSEEGEVYADSVKKAIS
jgi:short-subunit dehydrogenase